jgi:predicted permease
LTAQYALTIALGMAAVVALVSVMLALGYQPLPYPQPESLVEFWETAPSGSVLGISDPDISDLASATANVFSDVGGFAADQTWLRDSGGTLQVRYLMLRPGALRALAVAPVLGRGFLPSDSPAGSGATAPAWISYDFWKSRYGGSRSVIGTEVSTADTENGAPVFRFRITGVLPPRAGIPLAFAPGVDSAAIWTILPRLSNREAAGEFGVGRLRPGASPQEAMAALTAAAGALAARYSFDRHKRIQLDGLQAIVQRPARRTAGVLSLGVMFLFLVALVNVAMMMIAEGLRRRREIATRIALGASRFQLWTELAIPKLALTLLAIGAGLGLSLALVRLFSQFLPAAGLGAAPLSPPTLNLPTAAGCALLTFSAAVAWTIVLARTASGKGRTLASRLAGGNGPGATSRGGEGGGRWRALLLAAQAAAAVCLFSFAAAATQIYASQAATDLGPAPSRTYILDLQPAGGTTLSAAQEDDFYRRAVARLAALPETVAVARTGFFPPLSYPTQFVKLGDPPGMDRAIAPPIPVSLGYFKTLGIPLLYGRAFNASDSFSNAERVAVITLAAARSNWPTPADAIGSQIAFGKLFKNPYRVIGVVGDFGGFWSRNPMPMAYIAEAGLATGRNTILLQTQNSSSATFPEIHTALSSLALPARLVRVTTMEERWQATLTRPRARMAGMLLLALAGLALSVQGIVAVVTALGETRRHELGLRSALGASRRSLIWIVVRDATLAAALGTAVGVAASFASRPLLRHWLGATTLGDPRIVLAAPLLFLLVAGLAAYQAARIASRADPAAVLRQT